MRKQDNNRQDEYEIDEDSGNRNVPVCTGCRPGDRNTGRRMCRIGLVPDRISTFQEDPESGLRMQGVEKWIGLSGPVGTLLNLCCRLDYPKI
jgi:hypothetical protein